MLFNDNDGKDAYNPYLSYTKTDPMKRLIFSFAFFILFLSATAQRIPADQLATTKGPLNIQPVFHGALVLSWNTITIYVDPYGGAKKYEGLAAPDLVLITDIHGDHLNPETLNALDLSKTTLIVPQAVADQLPEHLKSKAVILVNDKNTTQKGISISAIPMYNLPEAPESRHPRGRGNGYLLNLDGKIIYISGDTGDISEMRSLKNIDVAFVCMNLPYTMDVPQAADAVLAFKPAIVYPYHYRGQDGLSDVEAFKKLVQDKNPMIEVRLRNWYSQ